ncbi:MAG: hypothetical protein F2802_02110, partial [Actinobacteria bacterium]|nr:hypothetical protein [Actinomycetota bacterium]
MTISLETILRHMGWANQQIFSQMSHLPDEALGAYITNQEWHVAEILSHITRSADWYVYRISGRQVTETTMPTTMKDIKDLAKKLEKFDSELLELA